MADIKTPITQELAPAEQTAGIIVDRYLKTLQNPDKVLAQRGGNLEVYAEVLRDDTVKSTFQQRRLAVVAAPWKVEAGADDAASTAAAEELKRQLNALNWDAITDQMLYGVFYGFSVAEIMWRPEGNLIAFDSIRVRDRTRFRFGWNDKLFLLRQDWNYEEMPERKFWTISTGADHSDNPYGLGLAHWLYWPAYFKRMDLKFWLIFLEKFGMPTAMGKLPAGGAQNAEVRNKLLTALRAISSDTAVVIPEGAEVEFLEATRGGSASYEEMKSAMDAAIAKIVLSQTMTTEAMGGQYKADVQKSVRDEVVKADADLICESFNRGPVTWWTEWNFPGATPPKVWRNTEPDENLNERAKRDQAIRSLGFEPTEDYIKETYGEGWVKTQAPPPGAPNPLDIASQDQGAAFAENLMLAALRAGQRADQTALVNAAAAFANQYEGVVGARVQQLLDYAEETGDFDTFRKRLVELVGQAPPTDMVRKVERANVVSRLLGAWRAQRPDREPSA